MEHHDAGKPGAAQLRRRIKNHLVFFIAALAMSGLTAFPLETELGIANRWLQYVNGDGLLTQWIGRVYRGVSETNSSFPFIAYGTDWLAFAHLVIAVAFIGPLRDPLRNIWVVEVGLIASAAVIPMALIAGGVRDIPLFWRLADCLFGLFGGLVLWRCHADVKVLEKLTNP